MADRRIVCAKCSKPVARGSGRMVGTETVHIRCAARETGLESLELQDRARLSQLRTEELTQRARELITERRSLVCALCSRSLALGGSVLFQGDRLVHASCWQSGSASPEPSPAASRAALQMWVGRVMSLDHTRRRLVVGTQEFQIPPDVLLDDVHVGVSVRVLYDPEDGLHRAVEVRTLSV